MSDILEPNFNGLPKPTDWKKVIVPLQQANEKEFRGATLPELADEMLKDKTINGQRMKAVPPGALPVGPSDKEMYMVLESPGRWTFGGTNFDNVEGQIMTLWWNKTTYSVDNRAVLPSPDLSDYPTKTDIDDDASILFEKSGSDLFQDANLPVRRYTSDTGITDYTAGYSQIAVAGVGDKINIPVSGSANNSFWVNLGKNYTKGSEYSISTKINTANSANWSVGFGYAKANGDYVGWIISQAGTIRSINKFTQGASLGIANTIPAVGDIIKITINDTSISYFINGSNVFTLPNTETDLDAKVLKFVMRGFVENTFSYSFLSSPIKGYVDAKISTVNNSPECFYRYVAAAKKMFVFTKIQGNTYVGFEIIYEYNMVDTIYVDYWRLGEGYPYILGPNNSLTKQTELLLAGSENECAWKQASGKDDFTGGYHGDELMTSLEFYANGVKLSWNKDTDIALTACDTFYYLEKSTMHESPNAGNIPVAGHPKVADHVKITTIHQGGYDCFNRLIWNYNGNMSLWYIALSCIGKGGATNYRIEADFVNRVADGTTGTYPNETGFVGYSKVDYWSSKYSSKVDSNVIKGFDDALCGVKVNDRSIPSPNDTKYYNQSPARTVSIGEIYESQISVRFNVV